MKRTEQTHTQTKIQEHLQIVTFKITQTVKVKNMTKY